MAQTIQTHTTGRRLSLITAVSGVLAVGLVSLCGSAQAAAHGGGGHPGPAGHAFGHEGGFHGGFHNAHGGWHRGGFERGGRHWYYGPNGALIEDFGYAPPVFVPPPVLAAPVGVYIP